MFLRTQLKEDARKFLHQYYWMAFTVCLIHTIITGIGTSTITGKITVTLREELSYIRFSGGPLDEISSIFMLSLVGSVFAMIFSAGLVIFLVNPVTVGCNRFFMLGRTYRSDLGSLFSSFSSGRYLNIVKVMFFKGLFVWLWSFLFVIPGVIKSYQYRMVPYILAENPGMDWREVLKISRAMTQGYKWNLFLLDLSFLGWFLLGSMLCGVGLLFVKIYIFRRQMHKHMNSCGKGLFQPVCAPLFSCPDCTVEQVGCKDESFLSFGQMQAEDLEVISDMEREIFSDAWSKAAFEEELNSPLSTLFVAVQEDGEIAGYLVLRCVYDEGEIINVAVAPKFRRLGCGRFLMESAFTQAKKAGLSVLMLEVRRSNHAAIKLYERFGFEKVGERKNYYYDPIEDAILMTCFLEKNEVVNSENE